MNTNGPWYLKDFENLCWHDSHIYRFSLDNFDDEHGTSDLLFDIDFILKWGHSEGQLLFTVCRAELRFHDVFGLKFELDYATPAIGMSPFSIDGIERKPLIYPTGYQSYHWSIPINHPGGLIEFDASGFTQTLTGTPLLSHHQVLSVD